jgi:hypothetical protein
MPLVLNYSHHHCWKKGAHFSKYKSELFRHTSDKGNIADSVRLKSNIHQRVVVPPIPDFSVDVSRAF